MGPFDSGEWDVQVETSRLSLLRVKRKIILKNEKVLGHSQFVIQETGYVPPLNYVSDLFFYIFPYKGSIYLQNQEIRYNSSWFSSGSKETTNAIEKAIEDRFEEDT